MVNDMISFLSNRPSSLKTLLSVKKQYKYTTKRFTLQLAFTKKLVCFDIIYAFIIFVFSNIFLAFFINT